MMEANWTHRVEEYVGRLMELTSVIDEQLDQIRLQPLGGTSASQSDASAHANEETTVPSPPLAALAEAVNRLEGFVNERDELLRASDAPETGLTLTEKLLASHRIDDARLAKRCREASEQVETTHQRAMALFVCQFHLANFGSDVLKLLSGAPDAENYGQGKPSRGHGGGLFNDAA